MRECIEIELKLTLTPEQVASVWMLPAVRAIAQSDPHIIHLTTTYFDTPEQELRHHGVTLRIREKNRQYLQTWKTAGTAINGLYQRHEWDYSVPDLNPDYSQLSNIHLQQWLNENNIPSRIIPLFQTIFQRTKGNLFCEDGSVVELAVDVGIIKTYNNEKTDAICEVELELKMGQIQNLDTIANYLCTELGICRRNITKAEAGYRLVGS